MPRTSAAAEAQHVGPQPHHTYTQFQGGLSLRAYSHIALGSHEMPGEVYNLPSVLNMSCFFRSCRGKHPFSCLALPHHNAMPKNKFVRDSPEKWEELFCST